MRPKRIGFFSHADTPQQLALDEVPRCMRWGSPRTSSPERTLVPISGGGEDLLPPRKADLKHRPFARPKER